MEWLVYVGIGLGVLFTGWKTYGKVVAATTEAEDNEFYNRHNEKVEAGKDVVEELLKTDIDGDGHIGKGDN